MILSNSLSLFVILVFVSLSFGQVYSPCTTEFTIAQDNLNHQHSIAYNDETNEYFVAYVEQTDSNAYPQTSVYGMRLDTTGNVVGNRIPLFTMTDSANIKQFPKVVYNSVLKYYLVLFQFDIFGNGSDYDILGRRIFSNGTLMDVGAYLVTSFAGNQDYVDVAFNSITNTYVAILEYEDERGANLGIVFMNGQGAPISVQVVGTSSIDKNPHIVFNPVTNSYFAVLEVENGGQGDIAGLQIGSTGVPNLQLFPIGYFQFNNGTVIHEHDPQILYAPVFGEYMVTLELYLGDPGSDIISDVVAIPVDPSGLTYGVFTGVTNADQLIEHSTFAYSVPGDDFVFVLEIQSLTNPYVTNLQATVMDTTTLGIISPLTTISTHGQGHHPEIASNTRWNEMLVLWNHGNETTAFTTGQVTSGGLTSGGATTSRMTSGQVTTGESPLTSDQVTTGESPLTSDQVTTGESPLTSGQVTTGESPLTSGDVTTGGAKRNIQNNNRKYEFSPNNKRQTLSLIKFSEHTFSQELQFIPTPSSLSDEQPQLRQTITGLDMAGIILCSPVSTTVSMTSSPASTGSLTSSQASTSRFTTGQSQDNISGEGSESKSGSKTSNGVVAAVVILVILVVALGIALIAILVIKPYLARRKTKAVELKYGEGL